MVRFHTLLVVTACSSNPGSKPAPVEPPNVPVARVIADAAVDAPEPPKLACDGDTTATPAPAPDPTLYCARGDGTREGPFVTLFPDQSIEISGAYKDGALDGAWERHHTDGAVIERGTYAAGKKAGTWTQLSPSGQTLGSYEMKAGTGVEKRWFEDGPLYSEISYKAGVVDGPMKIYTHDGVLIDGVKYRAGKPDGTHAFGTRNSMRFEETFGNGVRYGRRVIWHQGLLMADENYDRRGRLHGPYTLWRSAKIERVKGEFSNGRRTGAWVWNDKDGKKEREGSYVAGKRDGDWMEWLEGNLVWNGTYDQGKPNGTFTYYTKLGVEIGHYDITDGTGWALTFYSNGKPATKQHLYKGVEDGVYQELSRMTKVVLEGHYAGGIKHGVWKEFTQDGVLVLEERYKRGKVDGVVKKYVDGKLATESTYVDGKAHGPYAEYRLEKPAVTGQFADDRKTGTWTHYNADGAVVRTATYVDGVLEGPFRELVAGAVLEGSMVAGRRSGTWTLTDKAGAVRKLAYRGP